MTSNVTLQTARQLSGLMVSRAVRKRWISRPPKEKATKCCASASCQRLASSGAALKCKIGLYHHRVNFTTLLIYHPTRHCKQTLCGHNNEYDNDTANIT